MMSMSESQFGANSHVLKLVRRHRHDWVVLILLGLIDGMLILIEPFHRYLSEEKLTPDIKYPFHHDIIPMWAVPVRSSSLNYCSCFNSFQLILVFSGRSQCAEEGNQQACLLYTSPSPRDRG